MSDNRIGKDAIKLTVSKVMTMIISMLTAILLSRFRTLEEYGTYSQILLVVNLMTSLIMLGLPNSINYFLARAENDDERNKFLSVYYTISTILSIMVDLILVCSISYIVKYFNNELLKNFVFVFAIFPWTKIIMESVDNVLVIYKKTSMIMFYRISNSIALLILIFIAQLYNWDFHVYMILFVFVEAIFAISVYVIVKNIASKLTIKFDKWIIINVLSFSIPLGLASVAGTLNIELDKLMIGKFFNTEQLAIFANASKEMPITIVATSLTAVLLPQLARLLKNNQHQEAVNLWGSATTLSYLIICFLATGFFTYAPDLITLLYSEKYLPGVSVFRIYTIVLLLRCTYFGMILNAKGKTKFIFYSSIISLVLNIVFNYILFKAIGFIGPAIATFLSQFIINLVQLIFTAKIVQVRFIKILPWKNIGFITIVNVLLGLLFYHIKYFIRLDIIIGSLFETILLGVLWGVIYLIVFMKEIKKQWLSLNEEGK
ncbi:MAG TPA: oligosaccharide flippase family protein [Clostridiales bacterium]|nr:oligosaccharide flippase family protein [Clostridiales bacterium]